MIDVSRSNDFGLCKVKSFGRGIFQGSCYCGNSKLCMRICKYNRNVQESGHNELVVMLNGGTQGGGICEHGTHF